MNTSGNLDGSVLLEVFMYLIPLSVDSKFWSYETKIIKNGGSSSSQMKPYPTYLDLRGALHTLVSLTEIKKRWQLLK